MTLAVESGTIHALVGENGAGKTTLMRILYGAILADAGSILIDGKPAVLRSSAEATAAGIGMVSQHYGIIPALTCLQNLVLGAEGGAILDKRAQTARADSLARQMGFQFDWDAEASVLSPAATQKLEILKLLWRRSRIMILDEPTAMLSPSDADALFESLRLLVTEGATVILVTHRLPEVVRHCSRVTVLRGGRFVAERAVSETNPAELARMIVGENSTALDELVSERSGDAGRTGLDAEPVLHLSGLTVRDSLGHDALRSVELVVRPGEIVGVAGVDGNGQQELLQAILGSMRPSGGSVAIHGADQAQVASSQRLRNGLRVIPEDRHAEGVIESWSLEENSALGLQWLAPVAKGPLVDPVARRSFADGVAKRFQTRHGGLRLPMASLSGGNQQRFVAGRSLELSPKLLVAFQPARGLDFGGTAEVYRAIREECARGMAALVISFDLDELLAHCTRIVVLNHGQMFEPPTDKNRDRETIGRLMVGVA